LFYQPSFHLLSPS